VTAAVIDLDSRRPGNHANTPLNRCDQPTVSTSCATLDCGGGLAYQSGRWHHVVGAGRICADPQPATCQHPTCHQTAELGQPCAAGHGHCCGCCWDLDDDLEGRQLWPTN
jgi:hypothetical protein